MLVTRVSYDRGHGFIHSGEAAVLSVSRGDTVPTGSGPAERPPRGLRARIRRRAITRYPYKVLVALAGAAVIAVGVVLLPLPGPGWVIIFLGLGIWASEFRWAARLLGWVRDRLRAWTRWMGRRSPFTRVVLTLLLAVLVIVLVAGSYIALRGVPEWVPDWVPLLS
jgi:uncharacterized protein (TIGR02611 family)